MDYLILYFFTTILTFSIIGYGYLLSKIVNKELAELNFGYQGLFGIFFLSIISYITIFFTKHGYIHNIIIHLIGVSSFIFFFKKNENYFHIFKLLIISIILFVGLLTIVNHDDFNYYHLTYSLGLTENKIFFGLGQFQHGYKHHSSIFFFNSIIYLPFIKFYLFHSCGWFTLLFANYLIIDYLLFKKIKELKFEYFFYLLTIIFINIKFCRIGGFGTDLSGQIVLLLIIPLIYTTLKMKINDLKFKSNLSTIIFLIAYSTTLKAFFILNLIFLIPFLFFFNIKKIINYLFFSKTFLIGFLSIFMLIIINITYTGCAVYPVKQTCLSKQLSWSLTKDHVTHMNKWYHQWSKAGAGVNYRIENPEIYIKNFNWVQNWHKRYFSYKGYETLQGLSILVLIILISFRGKNKSPPDKKDRNFLLTIYVLSLILLFEWFYNHPAFRYGGYYLISTIFFIPVAAYLAKKKNFFFREKKNYNFFNYIFLCII